MSESSGVYLEKFSALKIVSLMLLMLREMSYLNLNRTVGLKWNAWFACLIFWICRRFSRRKPR